MESGHVVRRSVPVESICVTPLAVRVFRSLSPRMRRPALSMRALDFPVRALAPRGIALRPSGLLSSGRARTRP